LLQKYFIIKIFLVANTIFGSEEEILLNSFMEKIEQYLISSQKFGRNMIAASTILEITLEDYHQSRQMFSHEKSNPNSQKILKKESNFNISI
jgi:Ulp1 family protease